MIKNILTNKNVQKIFFRNYFYAIKKLNSSQGCSVRPAEFFSVLDSNGNKQLFDLKQIPHDLQNKLYEIIENKGSNF